MKPAIVLSLPGWDERALDDTAKTEGTLRAWSDESGSQLSLHRFDRESDLAAPLSDVSVLREQDRHVIADQNGAVVSVNRVEVAGLQALKTVLKFQQNPTGMTDVGSYTFPFESFSQVVRGVCPEVGTTGIRDTLVAQNAGGITEDGMAPVNKPLNLTATNCVRLDVAFLAPHDRCRDFLCDNQRRLRRFL
jgi:hypothetical protein